MQLGWRDFVATILVAAIVVPYGIYLVNGSMPYIRDPTGMAGLGLILGIVAAAVGGWITVSAGRAMSLATVVLGIVALGLGITTLATEYVLDVTSRQIVLGAFIVAIMFLWALAIRRHSGSMPISRLGRG